MHDLPPPTEASPLAPSGRAIGLSITGALMLAVPFLLANPGFGLEYEAWPWEEVARHALDPRVDVVRLLWAATGLWCLLLGMTRQVGPRAYVAAGLAGVLLVETTRGLAPLEVARLDLAILLPLAILGGGHRIAGEPGGGRLGRAWAGLGGLWTLAALATTFPGGVPAALPAQWLAEVQAFLEAPGDGLAGTDPLWQSILPTALLAIAALGGALAGAGLLRGRLARALGFWILVAGLVLPGLALLVELLAGGTTLAGVLTAIVVLLVGHGVLAWMLAAHVIEDLGRAHVLDVRADNPLEKADTTSRVAAPLPLLVVGLLLIAGLGLARFNPGWGAEAEAWPHEVLQAGDWTPTLVHAAALLVVTGLLLIGVFVRPAPRRGRLVLLATGLGLLAFVPTRGALDVLWLLPLVVALVGGLLVARGRGVVSRGPLLAALLVLAGLLWMPWDAGRVAAEAPQAGYNATATVHLDRVARGAELLSVEPPNGLGAPVPDVRLRVDGQAAVLAWTLPTLLGLLLLGVGIVALVSEAAWARWVAWVSLLAMALGAAWVLFEAGRGLPDPAEFEPWIRGARRMGGAGLACGAVWALVLAAAAGDRRPRRLP